MMAEDGLTEFAMLFKQRDNSPSASITIGTVITPPPEVQIRLNEVVVLDKENLVFAAHMLADYEREADFSGGNIIFSDSNSGTTESGGGIVSLNVDTSYEAKHVKIKMIDTLKPGDEVILMPVTDGQTYYVLDKAVMFA